MNKSSNKSTYRKKPTTTVKECRVCGAPAQYSYFGSVTCASCKIFFKRKAEQGLEVLKCIFGGHCEVNINARHVCAYCRLRKCFANGMLTEKFRPSHTTKRETGKNTNETTLVRLNQPEQLPTLNLLTPDQSTLTLEQWNLLSNIAHCYDEYSALSVGEEYAREQTRLPLKLRYKSAPLMKLFEAILNSTQILYQNNPDFRSLSSDDRSLLVQTTMIYTATLSTNFIVHKVRLTDSPAYFNTVGMISDPSVIPIAQRMAGRLNFDTIAIKLLLAIVSFSTISHTFYSNVPPQNLSNIKQILHIQDTYVDLLWRYLVYEYNYEEAVRCFSNVVRCLFAVNECVVQALNVQWYASAVDCVVEQTKRSLNLND